MNTTALQVIMLLGFVLVVTVVHICGTVIACLTCRLKVEGVSVFYGKSIMTIQTPLCPVAIGCLPCGGSVSFDFEDFEKRPFLVRSVVVLSGAFAMLLMAGICLRIDMAASQVAGGFTQIIMGAVAPLDHGTPLVRAFFERASESLVVGCGIVAAKLTALNMFPIPPLIGGRLLGEIPRHRPKGDIWMWCNVIGAILVSLLGLCWLAALVNHWRHL